MFGIDNFSQFDPDGRNYGIIESRRQQLGLDQVELIDRDYEDALANLVDYIGPLVRNLPCSLLMDYTTIEANSCVSNWRFHTLPTTAL